MNSPSPQRLLSIVGAMTLASLINGCTLFTPQPKGQIVVQAVSWTLVKKWAEPDAGLPGHKVIVQSAEDHSVIAEKLPMPQASSCSMFPPADTSCSASAISPKP